jgi:hypothetical protein
MKTWISPSYALALGFGLASTSFAQTTATKLVPIVLDVAGVGSSRYTTELTLANRGTTAASVSMTYTPATSLGATGGGKASTTLAAGRQLVLPDVIAYLRGQGLAIPTGSNQGGTLLVSLSGLSTADAAYVSARTSTPSGPGRAGLAYPGVDLQAAETGTSYLFGLRSTPNDRTNLALVNASSTAPVTLRVTLFSADAGNAKSFVLSPDTTLQAGQWTQVSKVLDLAGYANGYAKVDVISGTGPYVAYAVINDNTTNDGSYLPAEPFPLPSEPRLLPVLVESAAYQSELVLTNPLNAPQVATLTYVESASPAGGAGGSTTVSLAAGEQKIIPGAIDFLRQNEVAIGPKGSATFAGALSVTFNNGASASSGFAGARTASPVGGTGPGEYGLFYAGLGRSYAVTNEAWAYGLQQNGANRSNLAVGNLGDAGDAVILRVDVYNGDTGQLAGSASPLTLRPGGWSQINTVLQPFNVASGYVHVVKTGGSSRFVVYGVVNDGGAPGQGTSDGSYLAGEPVSPITSFSVGPDIALTYPSSLTIVPDEHTTFIPPASGSNKYIVFAANMKTSSGLAGPVALETTDLRTFAFASGYTSPVMTGLLPFTTCKSSYDPTFDLNYASPGSVLQDPTRPPGNLMMIYEAENHCPGAVYQFQFYVTVGFTRSSDGGKTWPQPVDAELGGQDRYAILKGSVPEPTIPENPQVPMGNGLPSAFVDGTNLYVAYGAWASPTSDGMIRVARAPLGGSGPLAFSKWYEGSFSQPGIGGLDTPVLPAKGCTGYQVNAEISYNDALGTYVMAFVCVSKEKDPQGTYQPYQAAWFYSTATSLDRQNWTAPRMIENSQFPVTQGCGGGNGDSFDGWYPSFMSPGSPQGHTSTTGSVFFLNGCNAGPRALTTRTFTIAGPPRPSIVSSGPPGE